MKDATVTLPLEEFDRLRKTIGKQEEEMAVFTKAVERVFQRTKKEVFEVYYSIQEQHNRSIVHREFVTGKL